VTNMDISISTSGLTTSYQFNTWTPNFGKLTKYNADRISRIYKASLDAINRIRQDNPKIPLKSKDFGKTKAEFLVSRFAANRQNGGFPLFRAFPGSQGLYLEGGVCNFGDALGLALPNLLNSFGCTIDQQWTAAGTKASKSASDSGAFFQKPKVSREQNGKFTDGVCPSSRDLDPYFSEAAFSQGAMIQKIDAVGVVNSSGGGQTYDLQPKKANQTSVINEVRSLGLRGPLIVSGWGFDVANNPVPSLSDDVTTFNSNQVVDRRYWKTGPVNLMWDDERKIWSGGPEIVCGLLNSNISAPSDPLSPTTFTVKIYRKNTPAGTKGSSALTQSDEIITCYNRDPTMEQQKGKKTFVMAVRVNYEWLPLWIGCPEEEEEESDDLI